MVQNILIKQRTVEKYKRWRLDNPNEEQIVYKAGWLGP